MGAGKFHKYAPFVLFCFNFCLCCLFTLLPMKVKFNDHGKNPPHAEVVRDVKTVKDLRSGLDELHYGGGGDIDEQAFAGETSSTDLIFVIFSPHRFFSTQI